MSANLPSRTMWRSAPMHLQCSHRGTTSSELSLYLPLLIFSSASRYQGIRHFQTSRPARGVESRNQASQKASSLVRTYSTSRPLFADEQKTPSPEQVGKEAKPSDPAAAAAAAAARARAAVAKQQQKLPETGSLAENSLFSDKRFQAQTRLRTAASTAMIADEAQGLEPIALELRDPSNLAAAINPRPNARRNWQKRMLMRTIRQRGRLTKQVKLARTERTSLSRSHFFKTSMKKLAPLARQIAGKPIDEAILQMRFSKKKVAKEVREHLIQAKHEAIVARGMGLGHVEQQQQQQQPQPQEAATTTTTLQPSSTNAVTPPTIPSPQLPSSQQNPKYLPGTTIPSNPSLRPPTSMYIAQAWINRGPYGRAPDYRARGRMYVMRPPHTGISVLLKEEKTRLREAKEKEEKKIRRRMGKNMWTQLPDRKVTRQGQYLLW